MTILLLGLGAAAAGLGTRLAAALFVGAAVAAASRGAEPSVATWTAALCAGWVLLSPASPRWIALPALGGAAAAAAGMSANAGVVLGLWVLGTTAAALAASSTEDGRRWAVMLTAFDLFVIAAIAAAALETFEGWPATMGTPLAVALLASAVVRTALVAGPSPDEPLPGLVVVRTQVAVLVAAAVTAGGPEVGRAALAAGAIGFAAAPYVRRSIVVDTVQELSLFATAVAATELGWTSRGWAWGALAAGTLIHHLRLMVGRGYAGQWVELTLRAGGLGLPFLPVAGAVLEGALGARGWEAAVLVTGLMTGLAGRLGGPIVRPRRRSKAVADHVRGGVVLALAIVASLSAAALSLPRPPGGSAIGWPGGIAAAAVVAAGIVGTRFKVVASRPAQPNPALETLVAWRPPVEIVPARPLVLWIALGALGCSAVTLWIVGLTRGFL